MDYVMTSRLYEDMDTPSILPFIFEMQICASSFEIDKRKGIAKAKLKASAKGPTKVT